MNGTTNAVMENRAVSWGAIIAGAVAAATLSLMLVLLGTGLGFSSVSPWEGSGMGAAAVGMGVIFWITITQFLSSGVGGYLTGRLRCKWSGISSDESYFRDSAHGFLAWSLATLLTATLLSSAVGKIVGATAEVGGTAAAGAVTMAGGAAAAAGSSDEESTDYMGYYIDSLFRKASENSDVKITSTEPPSADALAEITRIFANALAEGKLSNNDAAYLGEQVADRTNLSASEATKHVKAVYANFEKRLEQLEKEAREVADEARAAAAYTALWLCMSLFVGAFIAAFFATLGGAHSRENI